ncbi:MAG: transcription factor S [Nanoarchaeota archaeon]
MEFCPKCGSVIVISDKKASCAKCGFKPKGHVKIQASEKFGKSASIAIVKEKESSTYPIVSIKCPKCKHGEAFFWTLQTRSSDESETKFYKCSKCEHTWRVYR